jgi:hypothetical protein
VGAGGGGGAGAAAGGHGEICGGGGGEDEGGAMVKQLVDGYTYPYRVVKIEMAVNCWINVDLT